MNIPQTGSPDFRDARFFIVSILATSIGRDPPLEQP